MSRIVVPVAAATELEDVAARMKMKTTCDVDDGPLVDADTRVDVDVDVDAVANSVGKQSRGYV